MSFSSNTFVAVVLALSAGAPALAAQQRIDVTTRARTQRPEALERQMLTLRRQLDSLSRYYNGADNLSSSERRRVAVELDRTLGQLAELSARLGTDAERAGEVRMRMAPLIEARASGEMLRAMRQMQEVEAAMPRGWIGFVAEGPSIQHIENGELMVRFFSYPRIVSVDPSSPAQRAGIVPADTLLAYNGRDVLEDEFSLTSLLRPDARVSVRVRRDGRVREVPVTVASAPSRIVLRRGSEVRERDSLRVVTGEIAEGYVFPRAPIVAPSMGAVVRTAPRPPSSPASPAAPAVAAPRGAFTIGFTVNAVAGAELTTITEGLGRTIGVSSGVLVTRSALGSLAYESGLRDGDVIVKVAGQAVRTVVDVRDLVRLANEDRREAELEILRQKVARRLVLRW